MRRVRMTCHSALSPAFSPHFCPYLSGSRLEINFILEICVEVSAEEVWRLVRLGRSLKESLWGQGGRSWELASLYTDHSCLTDPLTQPRAREPLVQDGISMLFFAGR